MADLQLQEASNILLLASSLNPGASEACSDLLSTGDSADQQTVAVTYTRSADRWATEHKQHAGDLPEQLAIISVGESTRSTAQPRSASSVSSPTGPVIETTASPTDLTGLAIRITEQLKEWNTATESGVASRTILCFDSLTAMLQYTDVQTAFRFLHTLTNHLANVGATGHYHLNPDAHDDKTVATLASLFDAVVEVSADGTEWSVRTRNP